jgi:FtsZ-interacting cell division protein ZipA
MNAITTVLIIVAVAAIVFAAFMYFQRQRTQRLRGKFGPEYDRIAAERGAHKAETELARREERVRKYHIRDLTREERDRFAQAWRETQARFVDDPRLAVSEADELVTRLMNTRGYPMRDFDQRAEDLTVDHPLVVQNYRAAHGIAMRDKQNAVNTEDLRRAMVHYRSLFEDLLGQHVTEHAEVHS